MKPINSIIVASAIAIAVSGVSAHAYEEGPVAQGGTIEGKVIYNGEVETRKISRTRISMYVMAPARSR